MNRSQFHIMILTGEPSGDFHAGPLIREIRALCPEVRITGIGGPAMKAQGADLFFDIDRLSAMGLIEVVKQFSAIKSAFRAFQQRLKQDRPDLVIFIDYPGFNLRAAAYVKARYPIPCLYYIAPKVWAWNASRLHRIKACMDHVALILPFELAIYKKLKIPATYVGNPLVDEYPLPPVLPGRDQPDSVPVIGLLPGSRASEVRELLPLMLDAGLGIQAASPGARFLVSAASRAREAQIRPLVEAHPLRTSCEILSGRPLPIFNTAQALIAASGTVTLEAALCRLPTVLIYRVSSLTYALARLLVKVKYVGLANLIAGHEVMPELIQQQATSEKICQALLSMLGQRTLWTDRLDQVRARLGGPGAPRRTAGICMALLTEQRMGNRVLPKP